MRDGDEGSEDQQRAHSCSSVPGVQTLGQRSLLPNSS